MNTPVTYISKNKIPTGIYCTDCPFLKVASDQDSDISLAYKYYCDVDSIYLDIHPDNKKVKKATSCLRDNMYKKPLIK